MVELRGFKVNSLEMCIRDSPFTQYYRDTPEGKAEKAKNKE